VTDPVICRSEGDYAERPVALYWKGQRVEITEILARWRLPEGRRFLVRVEGEVLFDLFYHEQLSTWRISESLNNYH
jgi:hypothetical protein